MNESKDLWMALALAILGTPSPSGNGRTYPSTEEAIGYITSGQPFSDKYAVIVETEKENDESNVLDDYEQMSLFGGMM